jgi:hypothetical protein
MDTRLKDWAEPLGVGMIVYLDQNKWIELARIVHGKDRSPRAREILRQIKAGIESGCILPLSHIHYIETARISNVGRKSRLGSVMWDYSKGFTMASYTTIVEHEIECALAKHFPQVKPSALTLIGRGVAHAFGQFAMSHLPPGVPSRWDDAIEKAMLTGYAGNAVDPLSFRSESHRENFRAHLEKLHTTKKELPKEKWDDWLYAIALTDILDPLNRVLTRHRLEKSFFDALGREKITALVDDMPTRRLDLHLHRQVLKNPQYKPKKTHLEDWAGLGVASCYCDVVVCENHMADMIRREGFRPKARIETNLSNLFRTVEPV